MSYDFNSSLYGSDGATVLSGQQQTMVARADNSMMDNFLSLIGAGVGVYTAVQAAKAPKAPKPSDGTQPGKIAAPVIATTAPQAQLTTRAKALIGGGVAAVLVIITLLLFRRK